MWRIGIASDFCWNQCQLAASRDLFAMTRNPVAQCMHGDAIDSAVLAFGQSAGPPLLDMREPLGSRDFVALN